MKIVKLPWLGHRAENKPVECYSIDVSRDGTKLASGGLDGKVKVWDVLSIRQFQDTRSESSSDKETLSRRMESGSPSLQRPLASMSRHNGAVTSVKFSPDNRFLVSGSDDKIALVWEKDEEQSNRPRQFGETEADLEHWTVRKRLVAHDNDIQDICWSPDGSLLITVGLDRSIIVWSGVTFERIKRYDIHQSMVKGIVFDPANKFFATASDDRTVRIFRYYKKLNDLSSTNYEFQMEQIVMDPFQKSPLTSYFRRMSWSPDGQHIAVPNAMNGPVTSVVIINRGNWATDVSLIGHEAPCEVCSFSPALFRLPEYADKYTTILASAGQDRTLAVWSTALTKPLVVAHEISQKSITDISWVPDGTALFLSSLDGSITLVTFEQNELGEVVNANIVGSQLERYGGDRDSTIMPESSDQLGLERIAKSSISQRLQSEQKQALNLSSVPSITASPPVPTVPAVPASVASLQIAEPISKKSATTSPKKAKRSAPIITVKGGKKRVAPTLVSKYSGPANFQIASSKVPASTASQTFRLASKLSESSYFLPKQGLQSFVSGLRHRSIPTAQENGSTNDVDNDNEDMGLDDPNSSQLQTLSTAGLRVRLRKFRKQLMERKYPTPFKLISNLPEALFSNQVIMNSELKTLMQIASKEDSEVELVNTSSLDSMDESLYFRVTVDATEHSRKRNASDFTPCNGNSASERVTSVIEIRNGPSWPDDEDMLSSDLTQRLDFQDPTEVLVTNDIRKNERSYILYFPYKIQQVLPILLDEELIYYVLISFDGTVQIIVAATGTYLAPGIELGSNVVASRHSGQFLVFLTSLGQIYSWKLPALRKGETRLESIISGISVAPVLNQEMTLKGPEASAKDAKPHAITAIVDDFSAFDVDGDTGLPFVVLKRTNCVYSFSVQLMAWVTVADPWYFLAFEKKELFEKLFNTTKKRLIVAAIERKFEQIQKGEAMSYNFDESNQELKDSMRSRYDEIMVYKY